MSKYADVYPQLQVLYEQEAFKCGSCLEICEIKAGIIVTECLHTICKACITTRFDNAIDGVVICPFIDCEEACKMVLLPCTMKECFDIVDYFMELYIYLTARDKVSEGKPCDEDQTPPVVGGCGGIHCRRLNALLLKMLPNHSIVNCVPCIIEKQNALMKHSDVHVNKLSMNCPCCRELVVNRLDQDLLRCATCNLAICWPTRGQRWGAGGEGDTSGGCLCGLNGRRCHRDCRGCQ